MLAHRSRMLGGTLLMLMLSFAMFSCDRPVRAAGGQGDLPRPKEDLPPATQPSELRHAVLAGGCFWCTEAVYEALDGVTEVISGYAGGTAETATYERYAESNHAEVVRITYDPSKISYGELLRVFFTVTSPTEKDGQKPDYGHQYRSAIFYADADQKRVAEAYIKQLDESHVFDKPIATTVEPLEKFYPAEDYHQDFVKLHPDHPYVRQWSIPKLQKLREHFKGELKDKGTGARGQG